MNLDRSLLSKCMMVQELFNQNNLSKTPEVMAKKSEATAAIHRIAGNECYKNGEYKAALMKYNLTILNAPLNTDEYSKGFANRSAVLYMLEKYEECLVDIERALRSGYNDELMPKLMKRKASCLEILNKRVIQQDEVDFQNTKVKYTTLSEETDRNIPCAHPIVCIARDGETSKRTVVATEDIKPGKVIAVEKPYAFHLWEPFYLLRCYNCCARCDSMIPCESCHLAMFCNETCRKESWNSVHKHLCPFLDLVFGKMTHADFIGIHSFLQARSEHPSWRQLWDYVVQADHGKNDVHRKGFTRVVDGNGVERFVFDTSKYSSFYTLTAETEGTEPSRLWLLGYTSAIMLRFFLKYTSLFADCPDENVNVVTSSPPTNKYVFLAGGLLLHNMMVALTHPFHAASLSMDKDNNYNNDCRLGWGIYPFSSLLDASCASNVNLAFVGNRMVLVAQRPIKKDQRLTFAYCGDYKRQSLEARQAAMKAMYIHSNCKCEACENNWPTIDKLPPYSIKRCSLNTIYLMIFGFGDSYKFNNIITPSLQNKIYKGDKTTLVKIIQRLFDDINHLDQHAPCIEFAKYTEIIRTCLGLLGNITTTDECPLISQFSLVNKYKF